MWICIYVLLVVHREKRIHCFKPGGLTINVSLLVSILGKTDAEYADLRKLSSDMLIIIFMVGFYVIKLCNFVGCEYVTQNDIRVGV